MGKKLYLVYGLVIIGIFALIHLLFPPEWSTWITWTNEMFAGTRPEHIGLFILGAFFFFAFVILWGINFLASFGKVKYPPGSENHTPPISVIIPALNEEKVIGNTLETYHLSAYPKDKLELVVVASGSTDKTLEICEQYQKHLNIVIVTEPQHKKGKPAALNLGLKHASNDILCVYDADNHVQSNTLNALIRPFYDANIAVTIGPTQLRNRDVNWWTKAVFLDFSYMCAMGLYFEIRHRLGRGLWIMGRNYAIRRSVLEEFGGWNEDALTEDLHLSLQLSKAGKKYAHIPAATSLEITPTTWEGIKLQRKRWVGGYKQNMESSMELDKRSVILRNLGMLHNIHLVNYSVGAIGMAVIFGLIGDFYIMVVCLGVFVIAFGILVNAVRKYGEGRYRCLLAYPWYFVLMLYMFIIQFKDFSNLEWDKTEK
ncbi:MAG: glycosyltransferase family 2 protein [Promethearchaeota archaeon]|nr:MAG: glycosyltransferase family 2 protein [Candidatus Lokiarchaeota archaeon]